MIIINEKNDVILSGAASFVNYKLVTTKVGKQLPFLDFSICYDYDKTTDDAGPKYKHLHCQLWGERATIFQNLIIDKNYYTIVGKLEKRTYIDKNGETKTSENVRVDCVLADLSAFINQEAPQQKAETKIENVEDTDLPF